MIEEVADVDPGSLSRFDSIIDVRSPAEFAEDRLPGAINLPVLSNEERALVGTIYVRDSHFLARRIGAAIVARNIAAHLDDALAEKPARYHPLLYCWRGGMRSNAMASVLSQIGWRVGVLKGGYRTWRRSVVAALRSSDEPLKILLIDGQTGTAKTELLRLLEARGMQTLDLEALAAHRGSLFGGYQAREQPSQKFFESELWTRLARFDASRPIAVEAESSRIGRCATPPRLWKAMLDASRVILRADVDARADYLLRAYADLVADPGIAAAAVERLRPFHAKERIEEWLAMAEAGEFRNLATGLMREHYDPAYERSRRRRGDRPAAELRLDALDDADLSSAAGRVLLVAEEVFGRL